MTFTHYQVYHLPSAPDTISTPPKRVLLTYLAPLSLCYKQKRISEVSLASTAAYGSGNRCHGRRTSSEELRLSFIRVNFIVAKSHEVREKTERERRHNIFEKITFVACCTETAMDSIFPNGHLPRHINYSPQTINLGLFIANVCYRVVGAAIIF